MRRPDKTFDVVCLCGSTRFKRAFQEWSARLALAGEVPLTVSLFSHADGIKLTEDQVLRLNAIHAVRIRLADSIFVLDVDGYIGEGTRFDIRLAERLGKTVRYLSKEHPGWTDEANGDDRNGGQAASDKPSRPEAPKEKPLTGVAGTVVEVSPPPTHPFPGADAHPDKCGGELLVAETDVPVARILAALVDAEPPPDGLTDLERISRDLGLDRYFVYRCLRGLADWLKTQRWTGVPPARNRYEDGPGDVTPEDCAKLEGVCREEKPPPGLAAGQEIERECKSALAQVEVAKKIAWAKEHGCLDNLTAQAREVIAAKGASSLMPLVEKRCGTCLEGRPYGHDQVRMPCNHYASSPNRPDGPPWEDCRFWKPCSKKEAT